MQNIPIVLIGHKDHGKSTLIGRLILDSKSVKEDRVKEIKNIDRASGRKFELAHLVDSFKEERDSDMTVDTTKVLLKGRKRNYQLIDVPGHKDLISQMLTGASGAQVALLVVSVKEGIRKQSLQHLEIAKLLGIEQLAVVINKMDEVNYQRKIFDELIEKFRKILEKIGYLTGEIQFIPSSALKGENVIRKSFKIPWYSGPNLTDFLEKEVKKPLSFAKLPLRFMVQDVYPDDGGEILVGRVESGRLKVGHEILFLPENKIDEIEAIRGFESILNEAKAGQNVGVRLKKRTKLARGSVGVLPNAPVKVGNILSGEIFWIKSPSQNELILECGTAQIKGELQNSKSIKAREKSFYKIHLEKPIAFDPLSKTILGKVVIKDRGCIIGAGNIR